MVAAPEGSGGFHKFVSGLLPVGFRVCSCQFTPQTSSYHYKWKVWTRGYKVVAGSCYEKDSDYDGLSQEEKHDLQSKVIFYLNRTACSLNDRKVRTHGMVSDLKELGPTFKHDYHQSLRTSAELQSSASVQSTRIMGQRTLGNGGPQRSPDSTGTLSTEDYINQKDINDTTEHSGQTPRRSRSYSPKRSKRRSKTRSLSPKTEGQLALPTDAKEREKERKK